MTTTMSVRVGPEKIIPVRVVRDLGVQFDEELSNGVTLFQSVIGVLLPPVSVVPDTPSRQSRSHDTACACTCHVEARLL